MLADDVLPLIRTRAELFRWGAANAHGRQMHEAVDILEVAIATSDPAEIYAGHPQGARERDQGALVPMIPAGSSATPAGACSTSTQRRPQPRRSRRPSWSTG